LACPYFMPVEKLENGSWPHVSRLPLGSGWSGRCTAPGHEEAVLTPTELQEFCNLGYAQGCGRLPSDRSWDSIRFDARTVGEAKNNGGAQQIQVRYVCERDHRPAAHGMIEFDVSSRLWKQPHHDSRVQRMAECFLSSYIEKRQRYEAPSDIAS
jgi:hypothetical protein